MIEPIDFQRGRGVAGARLYEWSGLFVTRSMDEVILPFLVKYEGRDADRHELDAIALGESVVGAGRLYTAVAHYCVFGFVPGRNYRKELQVLARPATPGSYDQFYAVIPAVVGTYGLHAQMYNTALTFIFKEVLEAVKKWWTRPKESAQTINTMLEMMQAEDKRNGLVIQTLAAGLVRANDNAAQAHDTLASVHAKLIDTLPKLVESQRPNGVRLVEPVGRTCERLAQFANTETPTVIEEADAEVIRGSAAMEVDQMAQFPVSRISEVNLRTGHCILEVDGLGTVPGKITDPAIDQPGNVYTAALNNHSRVVVDAKAVRQSGEIKRLYVHNAVAETDRK